MNFQKNCQWLEMAVFLNIVLYFVVLNFSTSFALKVKNRFNFKHANDRCRIMIPDVRIELHVVYLNKLTNIILLTGWVYVN